MLFRIFCSPPAFFEGVLVHGRLHAHSKRKVPGGPVHRSRRGHAIPLRLHAGQIVMLIIVCMYIRTFSVVGDEGERLVAASFRCQSPVG